MRRARLRRRKEESTTGFPPEPTYTGVQACADAWIKYVKADAKAVERVRSMSVAFLKDYPTTDNPQAASQWSKSHFDYLSTRNYTSCFITTAFETASIESDGYPRVRLISEVTSTSFDTSIHTFKDGRLSMIQILFILSIVPITFSIWISCLIRFVRFGQTNARN